MRTVTKSIEQKKIASLARQYSALGYEVFAQLPGSRYIKPEKIVGHTPDMIVKKGDRTIIIEVVSSSKLRERTEVIESLAAYAKRAKELRFDLVVTNPRPTKKGKSAAAIRQLRRIESRMLELIDVAAGTEQRLMFFAVAGIVVEYLLVHLWEERFESAPVKESPVGLAAELMRRNVISDTAFAFIKEIWHERNEYIHRPDVDRAPHLPLSEANRKLKSLAVNYGGVRASLSEERSS